LRYVIIAFLVSNNSIKLAKLFIKFNS